MNWLKILQTIAVVAAVGAGLGAGVGGFFYAFKSKTNKLLKEQIEQSQKNFEACRQQHTDSLNLIHNLEGQIEVIKAIPLLDISIGIKGLAESNAEIVRVLKASAVIAATDRGSLLSKNQNVDEQIVEHQTIKNNSGGAV